MDQPIKDAPKLIDEILYGTKKELNFKFDSHFDNDGLRDFKGRFEGVIPKL